MNISCVKDRTCVGCKACENICKCDAISFRISDEGFWYPVVDDSKCVDCSQCYKICPAINMKKDNDYKRKVYAGWHRNDNIRLNSTSGGVYQAICEAFIKKFDNAEISGCVYTDDFKSAHHIISKQSGDLEKIIGSKYFQSDTTGIFGKIEEALQKGKKVLFTGSPCQVAALRNYIGENENLYMVDFICRGVPSPKIHRLKIELYERENNSKVTFYRDKSKEKGWEDFGELVRFQNGKKKFISRWKDYINDCFVSRNLNLREACFECPFKNGNNFSDITLGDFWGIKGVTERDLKYGVSAMVINSAKGESLLDIISDSIYYERRTINEIEKGNPAYVVPTTEPSNSIRQAFFRDVDYKGLRYAANKYSGKRKLPVIFNRSGLKQTIKVALRPYLWLLIYFKEVKWCSFVKYNFFDRRIKREKHTFFIPCKGSVIRLDKSAKINLKGNFWLNFYPGYARGKSSALLNVGPDGLLEINNRCEIAYDNTIAISNGAHLELGHFFTGVGTSVICNHHIKIGNNVMLGRDVSVFDSDYHPVYDEDGVRLNGDKEVDIEDCVWIGAKSMILKGSHIKRGAIVSANSVVLGEVSPERVFVNKRDSKSIGGTIIWER